MIILGFLISYLILRHSFLQQYIQFTWLCKEKEAYMYMNIMLFEYYQYLRF